MALLCLDSSSGFLPYPEYKLILPDPAGPDPARPLPVQLLPLSPHPLCSGKSPLTFLLSCLTRRRFVYFLLGSFVLNLCGCSFTSFRSYLKHDLIRKTYSLAPKLYNMSTSIPYSRTLHYSSDLVFFTVFHHEHLFYINFMLCLTLLTVS